jgi:hypothetical protein
VDIEFSGEMEGLDGMHVPGFGFGGSVEESTNLNVPSISEAGDVNGVQESAVAETVAVEVETTDVVAELPVEAAEMVAVEIPADIDLSEMSILETVPIVGTFDMSEAVGETLDIPEFPQEFQDAWTACEEGCIAPGVEMFAVWEELSGAVPELGLTELDTGALEEQHPAHASLPTTAVLLGGAIGALAFRRRRQTRSMGG